MEIRYEGVGGSMQVGDLVIDHSISKRRMAIILAKDYVTTIGTPFDWLIFYIDTGQRWGADNRDLEVVCK